MLISFPVTNAKASTFARMSRSLCARKEQLNDKTRPCHYTAVGGPWRRYYHGADFDVKTIISAHEPHSMNLIAYCDSGEMMNPREELENESQRGTPLYYCGISSPIKGCYLIRLIASARVSSSGKENSSLILGYDSRFYLQM
ncbi:hypothetical protein RB195_017449 [Necator americanus]|uniref:Uncharacterized protein n=1 Tax=Necator americanus TaxID=51031 RepID=A0ABR1C5B6_NECAM